MLQGGGRDDQVGLREGMPHLATLLDEKSPLEHDVLGHLENALLEHRTNAVPEPFMQLDATDRVNHGLDAESNLGEGDGADEQVFQPLPRDEAEDARIRARAAQFRQHICVEQPAAR